MIKLRVVGSSDDHDKLILSNKPRGKKGSHVIEIDKRLIDTLQEAVYARRDARAKARASAYAMPARVEPRVSPAEIQRQLRAGATPSQVASSNDLPMEYVERFLQPIIYERIEVVNEVQDLVLEKPRKGPSAMTIGEAVVANLVSRRVLLDEDRLTDAWHATRRNGGPWTVTLTFPFRGRPRVARWRYDRRTKAVEAVNKLASDLGWSEKKAKRASRSDVVAPSRSKPTASRRAPAKKKPAKKKPAKKKPAKKKVARKAAGKKRSTPKRKAPAKRKPVKRKPVKRKTAARKKPVKRKTTARRAPARKKPAARKKPTARRAPVKRKPVKRKPVKRKPARRKPAARKRPTATRRRR